ncbi:MAG: flagellin [Alphaproteobacteria bacterium]
MPQITIGDLTQSKVFNHRNALLKDRIQNLSTEVTTGLTSKTTESVRGDYTVLSGIEASLTQLAAFKRVTSEMGGLANHMQLVLNAIADSGLALAPAMLAGANSNSAARISTVGAEADQRLQSAISALNTRFGARTLFGGVATDTAAVTDAETLMAALTTAVTGALSAKDVETAVNDWFTDLTGFDAVVYQGGAEQQEIDIGPDEKAKLDITAKDPAIKSMLKGFAMASLLTRGILTGDDAGRAELAKRAGESLAISQLPLAELTGRLGVIEASIVNAGLRNEAEKSGLETARLGLLGVDIYEATTMLQESQFQLETLYSVTARMSRLSLVNYL